jgi:hypothetical protein
MRNMLSKIEKLITLLFFRNENDRYLYFYDQTEGGEKSWSLDHRNPEGIISLVGGSFP